MSRNLKNLLDWWEETEKYIWYQNCWIDTRKVLIFDSQLYPSLVWSLIIPNNKLTPYYEAICSNQILLEMEPYFNIKNDVAFSIGVTWSLLIVFPTSTLQRNCVWCVCGWVVCRSLKKSRVALKKRENFIGSRAAFVYVHECWCGPEPEPPFNCCEVGPVPRPGPSSQELNTRRPDKRGGRVGMDGGVAGVAGVAGVTGTRAGTQKRGDSQQSRGQQAVLRVCFGPHAWKQTTQPLLDV